MKKNWWWRWTVEKPAAFGDLLWDVLVVQFADFLNRLTIRKVVSFIPVVALVVAYSHNVPVSPALLLLGDAMAYLDILAILFLIEAIARAGTILYVMRRMAGHAIRMATAVVLGIRRLDFRHRRSSASHRTSNRKRLISRSRKQDDDDGVPAYGVAFA
jgi:hypothetical protein